MLQPDDKRWKMLGFNIQGDLGPITFYTSARNELVAFAKAPPLSPASPLQRQMRDFFRLVGTAWRALTPATRKAWAELALKGRTRCTGYNLFLWFQRKLDRGPIETLQQQTGITVI